MNHEHLDILMNRAIDGKASQPEREELARALLADPALRAEYDELMGAHISTVALFERLELPTDFTTRVMRRVQPDHVPTDADLTAVIEDSSLGAELAPEPMSPPALAPAQHGRTALLRRQAKITTILSTVGALSAAAALLLAIGLLTGIIGGSNTKPQQPEVSGQPGGPAERRGPAPTPAPKREPGTPGKGKEEPGVPDSPKPEQKAPDKPAAPKSEEDEEDKHKVPDQVEPKGEPEKSKEATQPPTKDEPKPDNGAKVQEPPKTGEPSNPGAVPEKKPEGSVDGSKEGGKEGTTPNVPPPQPPVVWGRLLCVPQGNVKYFDENNKLVLLDEDTDVRMGMRFSTSANCVCVYTWQTGGYFSAGGRSVFTLTAGGFGFEEGEIYVDYDGGKQAPMVSFDAYVLQVKSGTVVLEHATKRKVSISQSSGQSVLRFGEQALVIEGGCQVDVEFGKMPASPKPKSFFLGDWCATARKEINLFRIDSKLAERKPTRTESSRLQAQITRMAKLPHSTQTLVFFMNRVLELEMFSVSDLTKMLIEVEKAFANPDLKELSLDDVIKFGYECTCEVKNYADWSKRFGRLPEFVRKEGFKEKKEAEARKAEEERKAREKGKDMPDGGGKEPPKEGRREAPEGQKNEDHKKDLPKGEDGK